MLLLQALEALGLVLLLLYLKLELVSALVPHHLLLHLHKVQEEVSKVEVT